MGRSGAPRSDPAAGPARAARRARGAPSGGRCVAVAQVIDGPADVHSGRQQPRHNWAV
jgi:hypothetical protein